MFWFIHIVCEFFREGGAQQRNYKGIFKFNMDEGKCSLNLDSSANLVSELLTLGKFFHSGFAHFQYVKPDYEWTCCRLLYICDTKLYLWKTARFFQHLNSISPFLTAFSYVIKFEILFFFVWVAFGGKIFHVSGNVMFEF